jgi:very-short-patch-repair endonuclease
MQHGVVTTSQLAEVGLETSAISKRARRGRLHRIHRGVYSVGHEGLSEEALWMAAVLACGPDAVSVRDRIPVTTIARTLADLSSTLSPRLVRRAIRQAEFLRLPTGIKTDRTRSDLERYFLRLCRRYRLPRPEVNVPIAGMTVDFLWRSARLIVETDSYATHGGSDFDDDRVRLRRLGYSVHHFSERQLELEPAAVAADVAAAL